MGKFLKRVIIKKEIKKVQFLKYLSKQQRDIFIKSTKDFYGKKIIHINATAKGGGVAELLQSIIPYSKSLGIQSEWYVINPNIGGNFFKTTNKFFDGLQGREVEINNSDWREYEVKSRLMAKEIDKIDCDILVIHDTQPLLAGYLSQVKCRKIFYNHVDTSCPFNKVWNKLYDTINSYQEIIFSNKDFVNNNLDKNKVKIFTPAIDPLSKKQEKVSRDKARRYLSEKGDIPQKGSLIVQVSRFDHWKNPIGLIEAFRLMKENNLLLNDTKLALVGFNSAKDNPLAEIAFKEVLDFTSKDNNIYLFYRPSGKNIIEFTMMAQNAADIVVQNSIKEGFGLTVSEAMWKGKAVIGGPASGIRKQIVNGKNGLIAKDVKDLAKKMEILLLNPKKRRGLGIEAKKKVRDSFLFSRFIVDFLKVCFSSF
ncbi:MAG: glycosyltransferase [Patescibacteria group bacterium]